MKLFQTSDIGEQVDDQEGALDPESQKMYEEMASRRKSFVVLENNGPVDGQVLDHEVRSNEEVKENKDAEVSIQKEDEDVEAKDPTISVESSQKGAEVPAEAIHKEEAVSLGSANAEEQSKDQNRRNDDESLERPEAQDAIRNTKDTKPKSYLKQSPSDLEIRELSKKLGSRIQSDDDKVYNSNKGEPEGADRFVNDDRRALSVLSNHNGSDASHATGIHKDSGYSDDLEERFHSDVGDISSTTSTDCDAIRRVRRRKTKLRPRSEGQSPKTHESVIIEPASVESETSVLILRNNQQPGFVKGDNILDNKEDVFRNRSKTRVYRKMSEESGDGKPKSHTCIDQPTKKTKRITASTVTAYAARNRRKLERKSADTMLRSSRSMEPPQRTKPDKSKANHRTSRSVELPRTLSNSTKDKSLSYLTAKYKPLEPKGIITNMNKSMRKYYQERQVFQKLLEVKRLQIQCGRANEQILVKRLIEEHANNLNMVGVKSYAGQLTLKSFERYLYGE